MIKPPITVRNLADLLQTTPTDIITAFEIEDLHITPNTVIDIDLAKEIAAKYGVTLEIEDWRK